MKKIALLMLLALMVVIAAGCGKEPPPPPPETPVEVTPPVEEEKITEPTPLPSATKLQESQLQTVYFDFDKFNLRSDANASLDANFNLLTDFSDVIVKIEGHCDERGTVEYNLSLGEKRAKATMDYLVGLGIDPTRVSIISYGKEKPADPGHNEAAWAKNRRAEFRIISQ